MRIQKVREILAKFERKLAVEAQGDVDRAIESSRLESQQLTDDLSHYNLQKSELEMARRTIHDTNQRSEIEVRKLERDVDERMVTCERSIEIVKRASQDASERISTLKEQIQEYQSELLQLGEIIERGKQLQMRVKAAGQIADHFAEPESLFVDGGD
jgi:DNA repair exonuclease SbcCD ATPase subunit